MTQPCGMGNSRGPSARWFVVTAIAASTLFGACADGMDTEADTASVVPDSFSVVFETTAGEFEIEFVRDWSPQAVARVHQLVEAKVWVGARIYRVNERYAQFGYSGIPEKDAQWIPAGISDEPTIASNVRGSVSFARGGPGTRSAILFVNRTDNANLDDLPWNGVIGFPPVGRVTSGMETIDALYAGYGDDIMQWEDSIAADGNAFLDRRFPELDAIETVTVRRPAG